MARSTSTVFKNAANAQETGEVLLALVTITSSYIVGGPLRVVQDLQNITHNGNTYTAFPFELRLPSDSDEGFGKVSLLIDNIDRSIAVAIKSIPPSEPPTVLIEIVLASQPNIVELSLDNLIIRNIIGDAFRIEGELWMDEEDLVPFPEATFTPQYFPGLFK